MDDSDPGSAPIDSGAAGRLPRSREFSSGDAAALEPGRAGGGASSRMPRRPRARVVEIAAQPQRRLPALDVFRGLTIAFMIMVNNNGGPGSWRQMNHSAWNGFTATDLVFPTFLVVVGISIVYAFEARLARGATRAQLARHTVLRAAVLVLFGVVVNNFPFFHLAHMRFYGVLQRIALCYLAIGLFYLYDRRVWTKVAMLAVLLLGYWVLVRWVPVPGAGVPGREVAFLDRNQNLVAWVDRQLMPGHLYEDFPLHDARDPEGLLSTLPALGTTLIGLLAGLWLRSRRAISRKTVGLAGSAAVCLALGALWNPWFPINKKMWTSSYVLFAAGWSLAIFALLYWALEQKGWGREGRGRAWVWPWLVFGSNAIVAYMISELLPSALFNIHFRWDGLRMNPIGWSHLRIFSHIPNPGWATFAYSVTFTAICFVPVWALYRKKIFLKV
ncbi:MAG: acyltransferase family protein [Acidobacteriota bacterium]